MPARRRTEGRGDCLQAMREFSKDKDHKLDLIFYTVIPLHIGSVWGGVYNWHWQLVDQANCTQVLGSLTLGSQEPIILSKVTAKNKDLLVSAGE